MSEVKQQLALLQAAAEKAKAPVTPKAKEPKRNPTPETKPPPPECANTAQQPSREDIRKEAEELMTRMGDDAAFWLWFSRTREGREHHLPISMRSVLWKMGEDAPRELLREVEAQYEAAKGWLNSDSLRRFKMALESLVQRFHLVDFDEFGLPISNSPNKPSDNQATDGPRIPPLFIPDCLHRHQEGVLSSEAVARMKAIAANSSRPVSERIRELREVQHRLNQELDGLLDQI